MRLRRVLAKVRVLETVLSKSKSKPSMTAVPKGRGTVDPDCTGPNMAQSNSAAAVASAAEAKPPSVYVAPPTERRMVLS